MPKIVQISEVNVKLSDFEMFWEMYPRRQKKGDALKAWNQTASIRPPIEHIISAIQEQCRCHQWTKNGGEFVPLPASWLRAWQWDDEV